MGRWPESSNGASSEDSAPGGCIMLLPGVAMLGTMPMLAVGATPMPMPMLCCAMGCGATEAPIALGCTAKMLCPRSRRTCFLLFASSTALRLRAAAVARIQATRSATSRTFLHTLPLSLLKSEDSTI